jgi:hypothetical protein
MTSLIICILVFVCALLAGRRSVVGGLAFTLGVGYAYGIARANIAETLSHFIFDAAVFGLYLSQAIHRSSPDERRRLGKLRIWIALLVLWPVLLFFLPAQDPMIELVGLRGAVFLLPFLLIGARLKGQELYKLSYWIAGLNLMTFAFAVIEFFAGVERFFPKSLVTEIIYASRDVAGFTQYRIPSTFTSAHAFAGTMVITLPFLVGAWQQRRTSTWQTYFLAASLVASMLGVFMAAARSHAAVLLILLVVITLSNKVRWVSRFGWIIMLVGVGWIVSGEERLQRFITLGDTEAVSQRVSWSINKGFIERALEYPLGNGLGGGGTSVPYFLQGRVKNPTYIENEYARIMLEQGIPGLCLWVAFLVWIFTRYKSERTDPWFLGRRLMWVASLAYFLTGLIGVGLFTSIPHTCLMLLSTGWIAVRRPAPSVTKVSAYSGVEGLQPILTTR